MCSTNHSYPFVSENAGNLVTPAKKLEETIRLAELVIEVLQQNQEHHAEVSDSQPLLYHFLCICSLNPLSFIISAL